MALSMLDKSTDRADRSAWPPAIAAEFEREKQNHNGCVGNALVSEGDRVRVGRFASPLASASGSIATCSIISGLRYRAGAGASTCRTAPRSNTPTIPARRATRPTGQGSSKFTIWKTSVTRKWSS